MYLSPFYPLGFKAIGVCAIGWHAAQGVVAIAHGYASGIAAVARHANDARAEAALQRDGFFGTWDWIVQHGNWVWFVALIPMVPVLHRALKIRRARLQ
jgi:hypothetical protein